MSDQIPVAGEDAARIVFDALNDLNRRVVALEAALAQQAAPANPIASITQVQRDQAGTHFRHWCVLNRHSVARVAEAVRTDLMTVSQFERGQWEGIPNPVLAALCGYIEQAEKEVAA